MAETCNLHNCKVNAECLHNKGRDESGYVTFFLLGTCLEVILPLSFRDRNPQPQILNNKENTAFAQICSTSLHELLSASL